jgi:6-phosphogluconolactonase
VADVARAIIDVADTPAELARHAAEWIVGELAQCDGILAVALSGGATPRPVYELLAAPPLRERMPWPRVHWFWGDERFVPKDHRDSNYRMVREALLSRAPVPPANIHPMPTEGLAPEAAAAEYDAELRRFYGEARRGGVLFDVTLLGIGTDGHTASLFPGDAAVEEKSALVVAVSGARAEPRITLTLPALGRSRAVAFLAAGAEKRAVLARIFAGARNLPAARIEPEGALYYFLDRTAAPDRLP